jgi:hypothetical protein
MDSLLMEVVKFLGQGLLFLAGSIKVLGDRQTKANKQTDDRIAAMDKAHAIEMAAMEENVSRLREKIESERIDFKDRLREITDYLYKRTR